MSDEPRAEGVDTPPAGDPTEPGRPTPESTAEAPAEPQQPAPEPAAPAEAPADLEQTVPEPTAEPTTPTGPTAPAGAEPPSPAPAASPADRQPSGDALQGWASPGWSPPGQTPQAPTPQTGPGYPPPVAPPGYPPQYGQTQPGYPPQYGQTQPGYPPQYPQPAPPGHPVGPHPATAPFGSPTPPAGPTVPGEGWYPQQPHYAPGWQAPVGPPPTSRRRGAQVALVVIAGLAAVALVVGGVIGGRYWLETRPLGEVTKPMTVHAGRLDTGHCLAALPADGTVRSARVVPCSDPHVAEVVGSRPVAGASWPGTEKVTAELEKWCEMDAAEQDLGLRPVVWAPTEQGWNQGDRTGLCLAWLPDGTMTGSFVAHDTVTAP